MSVIYDEGHTSKRLEFKCPECHFKGISINRLADHVDTEHTDIKPDDWTAKRFIFNRKYKKENGYCIICKKITLWNEDKCRYERLCEDPHCSEKSREQFKKACLRKLGTDNPAADPDHQKKALAGREISGNYKFRDGGNIGYVGTYELDLLNVCDNDLNIKSKDIEQCGIVFEYIMEGKEQFHIPDYYIPMYRLIIQVKATNNHPNFSGPMKVRQMLADKAIIADGTYNYIVILDKDYGEFINMIEILKSKNLSNISEEPLICIPKHYY